MADLGKKAKVLSESNEKALREGIAICDLIYLIALAAVGENDPSIRVVGSRHVRRFLGII